MGAVFLARDLRLDRPVALKVLPAEFAADPGLRERFLRETRTAASFSHPNIVPVHAVVEQEGLVAFAMGYVEGESLGERVRRAGPLDVRGTVRLLQDIGYALAYAHGRGVVHRDIKPDNIMLERATGRALLMDFGISRTITAPVDTRGLTRVGEVVGSPEYMSPEQASGDVVDGRSDIYALGLVALFALTGNPAITGDSTQKILVKQLTELPPSAAVLRPDLPATLAAAIDRCVAKQPEERFQDRRGAGRGHRQRAAHGAGDTDPDPALRRRGRDAGADPDLHRGHQLAGGPDGPRAARVRARCPAAGGAAVRRGPDPNAPDPRGRATARGRRVRPGGDR